LKIVVVVRGLQNAGIPATTNTERKEYPNAVAFNNERGELVISKQTPQTEEQKRKHGERVKMGTIAVFKEWLYWEKIETEETDVESKEEYEPEKQAIR